MIVFFEKKDRSVLYNILGPIWRMHKKVLPGVRKE